MVKKLLTIAGSDPSGGAGIQADMKTFCALGCYAMSVVCSVTAQNTTGVFSVSDVPVPTVKAQLEAVFSDIGADGVKIGMVSNAGIIEAIADALIRYMPKHIVLDPVMMSTSGHPLLKEDAISALIKNLMPLSEIVTPNLSEAEMLSEIQIKAEADILKALCKIRNMGAKNVLIKGGHLSGRPIDTLLCNDKIYKFSSERINTVNTHGTGCTLSSAIAAFLAQGDDVCGAVRKAKDYLLGALKNSYPIGLGHGPVNHFWKSF
ncbi:MAG: bifunctional hydroxymethylpyrimidine kinase/phosphomethylpyrimidine kinase [Clostridia bacterium]|nr:bifunctional hydroxymethylpyrimidine kinase/phosphomethylpyrimidine kinase [Clostridia bacterium]